MEPLHEEGSLQKKMNQLRPSITYIEVMSSFEQHFTIRELVFPFLSGPALLAISQVHSNFRNYLELFIKGTRRMMNIRDPDERIYFVTELKDHSIQRCLCELVRYWAAGKPFDLNLMLYRAAENNQHELCSLVHQWSIADGKTMNWGGMLEESLVSRDRKLCELAYEWAGKPFGWYSLFGCAASSLVLSSKSISKDCREYCELVYKWAHDPNRPIGDSDEPMNYNGMLANAAYSGNRELCELAREWTARCKADGHKVKPLDWNEMLIHATIGNHRDLCELAGTWGSSRRDDVDPESRPIDWNQMIWFAAHHGRRELCELARERGATDFNTMFNGAFFGGHYDICELAREWGAVPVPHIPHPIIHFDF